MEGARGNPSLSTVHAANPVSGQEGVRKVASQAPLGQWRFPQITIDIQNTEINSFGETAVLDEGLYDISLLLSSSPNLALGQCSLYPPPHRVK